METEISEYVAEKISAMMENKFGDLSSTLTTGVQQFETESRVSKVEDNMSAMG